MNSNQVISTKTMQPSNLNGAKTPSVNQRGLFDAVFREFEKGVATSQNIDFSSPGFIEDLLGKAVSGFSDPTGVSNLSSSSDMGDPGSAIQDYLLQMVQNDILPAGALISEQFGMLSSSTEANTGGTLITPHMNEKTGLIFPSDLLLAKGSAKNDQELKNVPLDKATFAQAEPNKGAQTNEAAGLSPARLAELLGGSQTQEQKIPERKLNTLMEAKHQTTDSIQASASRQAGIEGAVPLSSSTEKDPDTILINVPGHNLTEKAKLNQVILQGDEVVDAKDTGPHFGRLHAVDSGGLATNRRENPASQMAGADLRLSSGQTVSEARIVDQVISRFVPARGQEGSSIQIKMHPEELGEVKLDLTIDHDRVKAQLLTHSQQVQDVLERHLPRLRSALEQQGFKLDQLEVNIDSNNPEEKGFSQQQNQHSSLSQSQHWSRPDEDQRTEQGMSHLNSSRHGSGSGLSLRI